VSHTVIFDSEAVQALADTHHPKHVKVLAHAQVVTQRKLRAEPIRTVVPTAVRVGAGWDRMSSAWALANQLRITDLNLDGTQANTAAAIRSHLGTHISVADAHVGAAIQSSKAARVTVLTSDPHDIRSVAGTVPVNIVRI
jgi:hypothetical protein